MIFSSKATVVALAIASLQQPISQAMRKQREKEQKGDFTYRPDKIYSAALARITRSPRGRALRGGHSPA